MNRIFEQYLSAALARERARNPEAGPAAHRTPAGPAANDSFTAAGPRRNLIEVLRTKSALPIGVRSDLPRRPDYTRQELFDRHAYARGARDAVTINSIESMMQRVINSGVDFYLHVISMTPRRRNTTRITRSFEARAFLDTVLGSGITLMDIAELMDIVSAPAYLRRVHIRHYTSGEKSGVEKLINISGDYDHVHDRQLGIKNTLTLGADGGRVSIRSRDIDVSGHARGLGFGARSLLQLALFARRHGVRTWTDTVEKDGILAWPGMGGEVMEHDFNRALASMEELLRGGAVSRLDLDLQNADIFDVARAVVLERDIADERSFFEWIAASLDRQGLDPEELEEMHEPYPVGMLALKAANLRVRYSADRILSHLLDVYFPDRILRRGIASLDYDSTSAHRNFVAAYRRGQRERRVSAELDQGRGAEADLFRYDLQKVPLTEGSFRPARIARIIAPDEEALPVGDRNVQGGLYFVSRPPANPQPTRAEWLGISQLLRTGIASISPSGLPLSIWSAAAIKP